MLVLIIIVRKARRNMLNVIRKENHVNSIIILTFESQVYN